ncbi:DNA primase [Humidisolicoccus flavus]|uniref:DNA primase n=1 Tax=Humidisolicoccus flavus TaxID=3111414 RepID=UPI0032547BB4
MALIRRTDIDEVRSRINIADVVGDYVTLKTAGVGSLKGLCPFHDERSPSFHVRPAVGRYHCFGCGEDGDVFAFVMAMDHTTFQESVERLAAGIGYPLQYEDGQPAKDSSSRLRILEANAMAAAFFREQLGQPEAEPGRRFLGERGFDPAAAERFGVGFAPKSFDALHKHLRSRGVSDELALSAGLLSEGNRGPYDRFRGRLMWPIRDVTGQVVGFGARKLFDDDQGPKYLNTPETPVFHKSQVLYGLDLAKRDISKGRQAVIVEGYTDVMACHLAGITTAVATCGTAFGVDHIKVLRRVLGDVSTTDTRQLGEVIFTFDPDEAGQKAASRAFAEEQRFAAQTFVAVPEQGLDPCDLRVARGDAALQRLIQSRRPLFEFMIHRVLGNFDLETVEGRVGAARATAPILAGIRDRALADGYVRNLAGWLGMEPTEVRSMVRGATRPQADQSARRDFGNDQPEQNDAPEPKASLRTLPGDPTTKLERDALAAMLQFSKPLGRSLIERGARAHFTNAMLETIRDAVLSSAEHAESQDFSETVAEAVPQPFAPVVRELTMMPIPGDTEAVVTRYARGIVHAIIERDILRERAALLGSLQRLGLSDPARSRAINEQLIDLEMQRRKLRPE